MFCENCGAKVDAGSKFCDNCGAPMDGAVSSAAAQPQYQQPQLQPPPMQGQPQQYQSPQQQYQPQAQQQYQPGAGGDAAPRNKKSLKKIIGFSALGLVVVFAIVIGVSLLIEYSNPTILPFTAAEIIAAGAEPEDISKVDLTGSWYLQMLYRKESYEEPVYMYYKLRLDLVWDPYADHYNTEVTTLDAYYNKEHRDYPGDGSVPPDFSNGKAYVMAGLGNTMLLILGDENNPYPHVTDLIEWDVMEGRYLQAILYAIPEYRKEADFYPFGIFRSEDSADFNWR